MDVSRGDYVYWMCIGRAAVFVDENISAMICSDVKSHYMMNEDMICNEMANDNVSAA